MNRNKISFQIENNMLIGLEWIYCDANVVHHLKSLMRKTP